MSQSDSSRSCKKKDIYFVTPFTWVVDRIGTTCGAKLSSLFFHVEKLSSQGAGRKLRSPYCTAHTKTSLYCLPSMLTLRTFAFLYLSSLLPVWLFVSEFILISSRFYFCKVLRHIEDEASIVLLTTTYDNPDVYVDICRWSIGGGCRKGASKDHSVCTTPEILYYSVWRKARYPV